MGVGQIADTVRKTACLIAVLLSGSACAPYADYLSFEHAGRQRQYIFYKPAQLSSDAPLLFVLHGYGGKAHHLIGLNALADTVGLALAYPQGGDDAEGVSHWNARLNISTTDDVGFLVQLAKHLQKRHGLAAQRTYSAGISNGGFMSFTLACEAADVFSRIASLIGTMSQHSWDHCAPSRPVSVLQLTALEDELLPVAGMPAGAGGWGGAPAMDSIIRFWAEHNGTTVVERESISEKTQVIYYRKGEGGSELWYFKVAGLGHELPDAAEHGVDIDGLFGRFFGAQSPVER